MRCICGEGYQMRRQNVLQAVGARMCSEYGRAVAKILAESLALHGVCVISVLALGTDAAGHRGALAGGGMTCAVLGCGIDVAIRGRIGNYTTRYWKGEVFSRNIRRAHSRWQATFRSVTVLSPA